MQAAPTLTSDEAATSGACELSAAAQPQLSGKPQPAASSDLGKSDATANAAPTQVINRLVTIVPATQGKKLVCLSVCLPTWLPPCQPAVYDLSVLLCTRSRVIAYLYSSFCQSVCPKVFVDLYLPCHALRAFACH